MVISSPALRYSNLSLSYPIRLKTLCTDDFLAVTFPDLSQFRSTHKCINQYELYSVTVTNGPEMYMDYN